MNDAQGCCTKCPICRDDCDITEEDIISADCGACGPVNLHVHCKEKYCRQQGRDVNKISRKGFVREFMLNILRNIVFFTENSPNRTHNVVSYVF